MVSTHAPARGATPLSRRGRLLEDVSTHAPARGATRSWWRCGGASASFNPRARTGRDVMSARQPETQDCFNPRARTGRDWRLRQSKLAGWVSTHAPARGATCICTAVTNSATVSTHAPARGATSETHPAATTDRVSTHAPARGATGAVLMASTQPSGFNPRARTGRDHARASPAWGTNVSTHAPARGATVHVEHSGTIEHRFNPRARTGRDTRGTLASHAALTFQPTRPHGARPTADGLAHPAERVSTHAPARGATCGLSIPAFFRKVSTHAPARGATGSRVDRLLNRQVSTHAPARGATRVRLGAQRDALVSTHAPARGATVLAPFAFDVVAGFNPRARTGRDGGPRARRGRQQGFNPRARTGRDGSQRKLAAMLDTFQPTRPHGARHALQPNYPSRWHVSTHAPARGATSSGCWPGEPLGCFNPRARTGRDVLR